MTNDKLRQLTAPINTALSKGIGSLFKRVSCCMSHSRIGSNSSVDVVFFFTQKEITMHGNATLFAYCHDSEESVKQFAEDVKKMAQAHTVEEFEEIYNKHSASPLRPSLQEAESKANKAA